MANLSERDENIQLIGFFAGQKLFGADILSVREILRDPTIEPLETAHEVVDGVVRLRGESIPLVNLKARLNTDVNEQSVELPWVLVVQDEDRAIGYMVDSVTRILRIGFDEIMPAPELVLAGLRSQYIRGVCKSELGLLVVMDLNRLLTGDEVKEIRKL